MQIAIIGSGISGLATAWGLRGQHDITLFEARDRLGGHTHTVDVEIEGQNYAVDTGFIVYNDNTYPHLIRLLDQLGLQGQRSDMSFSVTTADGRREYASQTMNSLFATRSELLRPGHWRMLRDILQFNNRALALVDASDDTRTLEEFLADGQYGAELAERYVYPLCAAIWSTSLDAARDFPAAHFARFFANHGLLSVNERPQWRTLPGGSRSYIERMLPALKDNIRLGTPVQKVLREDNGATVYIETGAARFDAVIFACHSDEALRLLADASKPEREILGALPYTDNDVVLHTDQSFLPRRRGAWASWNYRLHPDPSHPATLTYHMNRLQNISAPVEFCVTLNASDEIAPEAILGQYVYAHPAYTTASDAARARRAEINGVNNTWFTGAYWYNGFHEDGARSALEVAQALGGGW